MSPHVPALAAADGPGPRRSLVLAGGGMRVAYQAGVLEALVEEGLTFTHADGTSGGTINLAMLLSGLSPAEMCERWCALRVQDFGSPLPLRKYLKAPNLPALGDADGVVNKVFPRLGVDVDRIRDARGIDGTFNVCNYTTKTNEVVHHTEVDLDHLVAGISLPIFMPAVQRGESLYTDSVWIKDANVTEAVRRGSDEIWLVWCIGNTGVYRNGPFHQYVHMIELSANGGLFEEFEHLRALRGESALPRLHVIKPEDALPLDPDFYFGRIDGEALVAFGYRDTKRYLAQMDEAGVPWRPEATRMHDPALAASFVETLSGTVDGSPLELRLNVQIPRLEEFLARRAPEGTVTGDVGLGPDRRTFLKDGRFSFARSAEDPKLELVHYEVMFEHDGAERTITARKEIRRGARPLRLWRDLSSARATLRRGDEEVASTTLHSHVGHLIRSVEAWNAPTERARVAARWRFGRSLLGELWSGRP